MRICGFAVENKLGIIQLMQFISQEQQGAETLFLKCYVHCGFYKEVFVL